MYKCQSGGTLVSPFLHVRFSVWQTINEEEVQISDAVSSSWPSPLSKVAHNPKQDKDVCVCASAHCQPKTQKQQQVLMCVWSSHGVRDRHSMSLLPIQCVPFHSHSAQDHRLFADHIVQHLFPVRHQTAAKHLTLSRQHSHILTEGIFL